MKKNLQFVVFALFALACMVTLRAQAQGADQSNDRYVVVLSVDGFRWDYPELANTPTLDSIGGVGVYSQIFPCFPATTFPNHYSMATGLHPDDHGIIGASFYDKKLGKKFDVSDKTSEFDPQFWGGEPIWNTVERQGLKSAVFMWVGCKTPIGGRLPSVSVGYKDGVSMKAKADMVLEQLNRPKDSIPNLIMWYIEEPDKIAHSSGPTSNKTLRRVEEIDQLINYFLRKARECDIYDKIDFIITSDHGMARRSKGKYVNLFKYLDRHKIDYVTKQTTMFIEPKPEYLETAYAAIKRLPHVSVYKRNEIPAKYHFGNNTDRIPSLVVVPQTGWTVDYRKTNRRTNTGGHGYDPFNTQMQMIFYGMGPSFKEGSVAPSFQNLNLHNIIAHLLNVEPAPNSGDKEVIKQLFK